MHKLTSKPITIDCFETDDFNSDLVYYTEPNPYSDVYIEMENTTGMLSEIIIEQLEFLRQKYLETKDIAFWKELIRWLPESWLQTRTVTMSYENLRNMYHQRQNHKLTEWHSFCKWVETLPYAAEFIVN